MLEAFRLIHVQLLVDRSLRKSELDIPVLHFVGRIFIENHQHNAKCFGDDHTSESFRVVHARLLSESHSHKTSLETDDLAILTAFVIEHELATNNVLAFWNIRNRNEFPSFVALKTSNFFFSPTLILRPPRRKFGFA